MSSLYRTLLRTAQWMDNEAITQVLFRSACLPSLRALSQRRQDASELMKVIAANPALGIPLPATSSETSENPQLWLPSPQEEELWTDLVRKQFRVSSADASGGSTKKAKKGAQKKRKPDADATAPIAATSDPEACRDLLLQLCADIAKRRCALLPASSVAGASSQPPHSKMPAWRTVDLTSSSSSKSGQRSAPTTTAVPVGTILLSHPGLVDDLAQAVVLTVPPSQCGSPAATRDHAACGIILNRPMGDFWANFVTEKFPAGRASKFIGQHFSAFPVYFGGDKGSVPMLLHSNTKIAMALSLRRPGGSSSSASSDESELYQRSGFFLHPFEDVVSMCPPSTLRELTPQNSRVVMNHLGWESRAELGREVNEARFWMPLAPVVPTCSGSKTGGDHSSKKRRVQNAAEEEGSAFSTALLQSPLALAPSMSSSPVASAVPQTLWHTILANHVSPTYRSFAQIPASKMTESEQELLHFKPPVQKVEPQQLTAATAGEPRWCSVSDKTTVTAAGTLLLPAPSVDSPPNHQVVMMVVPLNHLSTSGSSLASTTTDDKKRKGRSGKKKAKESTPPTVAAIDLNRPATGQNASFLLHDIEAVSRLPKSDRARLFDTFDRLPIHFGGGLFYDGEATRPMLLHADREVAAKMGTPGEEELASRTGLYLHDLKSVLETCGVTMLSRLNAHSAKVVMNYRVVPASVIESCISATSPKKKTKEKWIAVVPRSPAEMPRDVLSLNSNAGLWHRLCQAHESDAVAEWAQVAPSQGAVEEIAVAESFQGVNSSPSEAGEQQQYPTLTFSTTHSSSEDNGTGGDMMPRQEPTPVTVQVSMEDEMMPYASSQQRSWDQRTTSVEEEQEAASNMFTDDDPIPSPLGPQASSDRNAFLSWRRATTTNLRQPSYNRKVEEQDGDHAIIMKEKLYSSPCLTRRASCAPTISDGSSTTQLAQMLRWSSGILTNVPKLPPTE